MNSSSSSKILRFLPLLVIVAAITAAFYLDLHTYLTFEKLREERIVLLAFVEENFLLSRLLFVLAYIAVVALSLPGATIMTLTGGFLFGALFGTLFVVTAASIGASIIFLVTRFALADTLAQKNTAWVDKLRDGFQNNAFSYLLTLRLIPIVPFFILNLVPALLNMRLVSFFVATFIGIIPGSFVYSLSGAGLSSVFESGEEFSISGIITPEVLFALIGLGLMSILPVVYKKIKSKKS